MKTLTKNLLLWSAGALILVSPTQLPASTLLIDRGLPTTNLNNAAGVNRSNTCWVVPRNKAYDTNYDLVGDTITNTTSTDYHIDTIRLWTVGPIDTATLWGGFHGGAINLLGAPASRTVVHYVGGLEYQSGYSGLPLVPLSQLDFSVSITLKAGQTFDFFFDGSRATSPFAPFVHASNAALSGSPQEGADNLMLMADFKRGEVKKVKTWDAIKQSWNKSTDVNVQVFGEVLEVGSTVAALASGGGFLPAPTPNTGGETVEPLQPTLEEFTSFASVQPGLTTPLVLPLLTMPSYPVYQSTLGVLNAVGFPIVTEF